MPDSLAPATVEPLLTGRFGRPYLYGHVLTPDLPEGAVAASGDDPGDLMCAVLVRPPADRPVAQLPLVAAIATADAVEHALKLAVQIRWPNVVMVNRFEVARVTAEERDGAWVVGIRLDVNGRRAAEGRAASLLAIDGKRRDRAPLLASALRALERAYVTWLDGGLAALYVWLGPRDFLRGRRVTVDGTGGVAVGVDRSGRLELEVDGEHRFVETGDVVYEQ